MLNQQPPEVFVIGEALMDILSVDGVITEAPGGSPANVALAIGRLGHTVRLKTALGADAHGDTIRRWLESSGVEIDPSPTARTSTARAHIDTYGAASYVFEIDWKLAESIAPHSRAVHTGSIGAFLLPGAEQVEAALRAHHANSTITFDPNIRTSLIDDSVATRDRMNRIIGIADIIKLSDEDLHWLRPDEPLAAVADEWLDAGAALVVVTMGAAGAKAFTSQGAVFLPAEKVIVVDTVGAGDTFMAALLCELLERGLLGAEKRDALGRITLLELERMLHRCVKAAGITVSRAGANPPMRIEMDTPRREG